jgi:hypothetical protein
MIQMTQRMLLALTHERLTFYAEGAKAYWRMWGPIGQPAIEALEIWEGTQRRHLQVWEAIVAPTTGGQRAIREVGRGLPADFFSGFGLLGFDD